MSNKKTSDYLTNESFFLSLLHFIHITLKIRLSYPQFEHIHTKYITSPIKIEVLKPVFIWEQAKKSLKLLDDSNISIFIFKNNDKLLNLSCFLEVFSNWF
jgi:hypothetical protein